MESPQNPSTFSPRRQELLQWFRTNAKPLSEAYDGALRLLDHVTFPGRVHFIAHAVRDIADRLAFVLDPHLDSSRVQYENEMDWIADNWSAIQTVEAADGEADTETVMIDYQVATRIDALVQAHRGRRQRPSNYELLFQYLMRHEPNRADVNRRLVSDFKKTREWFMKLTHLRDKEAPHVDEDEMQLQFRRFETMLHSFVGDFFTGTAEIDEILRQANC
jgi:hypothetical protein